LALWAAHPSQFPPSSGRPPGPFAEAFMGLPPSGLLAPSLEKLRHAGGALPSPHTILKWTPSSTCLSASPVDGFGGCPSPRSGRAFVTPPLFLLILQAPLPWLPPPDLPDTRQKPSGRSTNRRLLPFEGRSSPIFPFFFPPCGYGPENVFPLPPRQFLWHFLTLFCWLNSVPSPSRSGCFFARQGDPAPPSWATHVTTALSRDKRRH